MLKIKRSGARVCWHVMFNEQVGATADTRIEARHVANQLADKYGLSVKG